MRIAFNIQRANWYRVLAPVIDEALERGHEVTCCHHRAIGADPVFAWAKSNRALMERMPVFRSARKPIVLEYGTPRAFLEFAVAGRVDAVVDVRPPPEEMAADWLRDPTRPKWVLIGSSDGASVLQTREQVDACDLVVFRSKAQIDQFLENSSVEAVERRESTLQDIPRSLGPHFKAVAGSLCRLRLTEGEQEALRGKSLAAGITTLDVLGRLEPTQIRKAWGIPQDAPVIALLPCPFGGGGAFWEERYMARNARQSVGACIRHRRLPCLFRPQSMPRDREVVRGLRAYAKRQNAVLVAKMRHSTDPPRYLLDACDLIVGDDSYYPHTTLELFRIASLTFGFYSSGSVEAVAAGSPYVDIDIPLFPRALFDELFLFDSLMFNWTGVVSVASGAAITSEEFSLELRPGMLNPAERSRYLDHFAGPMDGCASIRVLHAMENL